MNKIKLIIITVMVVILATAVQGALSDGQVVYYSCDNDNTAGTTAIDSSGNINGSLNNGTVSGYSGIIGQSYFYDNTNDNLNTNSNIGISGANTRTVNVWINISDGTAVDYVFCMGYTGVNNWFAIYIDPSEVVQYSGYGSDFSTGASVTLNQWHMITATYTGTHVRIYVDGNETPTSNQAKTLTTTAKPLVIGNRCDYDPGSYYPGTIDEIGVWNRTLNQTEITDLYNSGSGLTYPFTGGGGGSTDIDFTITDDWNGSSILSFAVNITWANTTEETYSTTNGTVSLVNVGNPGSLDVTYWNMTDYFDRTLTGESITANTTNTIATTTYQARVCFDGQAYVSNASLTPDNFTIGTTSSSSCFNITAGDHNVLAQLSGWYNKNQTFTISALSDTTQTVVNMSYANLTISAIDGTTNETLSNYDLTIRSLNYSGWAGEDQSSVTNYSFYLINGSYNVTIDNPDYALTTAQANITVDGATNYTFTLYKSNSVRIYLWDEITGNPILDNITIRWTSNLTTWENTTDTGQLFVSNITAHEYELLFYAGNYSTRTYTITVGNRTTQILNAYMINSEYSSIFTMKDIDTGDTLDSVSITMYKLINSTWTTVESKTSDISGKAQFYYDPIASYKFFLARSDYEDYVFFLNPILFSTYDVFMTKTTVLNYSVDFDDISIIYAPAIFYNNDNVSFNYLISSPDGTLTDYSITLTYPGGSSTASGVNAIGEQLTTWVNITGATSFDSVTLEYNYTTTLSGERSFKVYLPIIVSNSTSGTWLANKNTTYGLGLFERLLIVTIIVLFAVGIATLVGQIVPGLVIGLFLFGFMVFIGFVPIWAILPSMLVGVLFVVWKSGGV